MSLVPKHARGGARTWRNLYRVGGEALTLRVLADRLGISERTAQGRIARARDRGVVTWATLGLLTKPAATRSILPAHTDTQR